MSTPRNNGPAPSWRRHIARVGSAIGSAVLVGGLAGLTACADSPITAPSAPAPSVTTVAAPNANLLGGILTGVTGTVTGTVTGVTGLVTQTLGSLLNGVLWSKPATKLTVTKVIGPSGGTFGIENGIQVTVPRGAVSSNVTFSVTRLAGNVIAYDFQPHGIKFAVPLVIQQPMSGANRSPLDDPSAVVTGAYFSDPSLIDQLLGTVKVSEIQPTAISADRSTVIFTVQHFSGYVVAWGRK